MKTTLYTHPSAQRHDTGPGHPECPARIAALEAAFAAPVFAPWPRQTARPASMEEIGLAHPLHYIQAVEDAVPVDGHASLDGGDTILSPGSWDAAVHAAGAVCQAVDDVINGRTVNAFCAMRPPGHHAEPTRAMGFCLFNNIFVGARHAQNLHGVRKVAIVDFDVHHGNGTDMMTRQHHHEKHGEILYLSSHQFPLFPMSGDPEDNERYVKNWTLHAGDGSAEFRKLYEDKIFPALHAFEPELLMISAGFDAHRDDPLAGLNLIEEDFGWVTTRLKELAAPTTGGKTVSVLEGGYNLEVLKNSVTAHLLALAGEAG
jgi:acetoin utilization deacetylase AcuC-like enzyme